MNSIMAALLFFSATPVLAQDEVDEHAGVRVREWFARMSGTIEADGGTGLSTNISLENDLGLGHRNLTHEVQAYARIPFVGRLIGGWWETEDSGSQTLSRDLHFAGQTFTASTAVSSSTKLDVFYLAYEFVFPTIPLGDLAQLELALQVSARGLHGTGSIAGPGFSGADGGWVGFPTIGGHVTLGLLSWIRVETEVLGMAFSYGVDRMTYFEAYGEVVAQPLPWIFAGVGYKYASLKIQHLGSSLFDFEAGVSGIYITSGLRF